MSTLKAQLRTELTASMKARDALRSSTLRMLLTAVTNAEVAGKEARELSDEEIVSVLSTEAKKRRESSTAYEEAGRTELAAKEQAEGEIIAEFLPAQLSEDDVKHLVTQTIDDLGARAEGMRAMGKVMGALRQPTLGRADGAVVSAEVRRQLAG